jgi:NAD(P)-dependent dehydrogenase (short-subunit alcohol dehydrogenase family)
VDGLHPVNQAIRFDGQVALVTGSGRGLGAAYARALAARGASVVVHDAGVEVDGSGGDPNFAHSVAQEIVAAGGSAFACSENLETEAACSRLVELALERFGRLDVVIQNAGLLVWEPIEEADRNWERMRRVNVEAPFHVTRAAFPIMKDHGYGRLVFTTSGRAMAVDRTQPGLAAYAVGKMAHFALTVVAAAEGADHGILANAIAPAAATRMLRQPARPGELEPEQVTPGVLFLASKCCTVSGKVLEAAGGTFSVASWVSSTDLEFGPEPVPPELIAARWEEIEGLQGGG